MKISIIVAASENHVIGIDNDLPWHLPDDMKFFVKTTKGHHILGGRKNFESFGKALPNRINLIVTRNPDYKFDGAKIFQSIEEAVQFAKDNGENELMVIGGGEIYRQLLPQVDRIYLTRVHANIDGHVYFPEIEETNWKLKSEILHEKDEKHKFSFTFQEWEKD